MSLYADFQVQVWPHDDVRASVSATDAGDNWVYLNEGSNLEFFKTVIVGATVAEAQAIADAINTAIGNAKSRALEAAISSAAEPVAQAAE